MKIGEVIKAIETLAPLHLQESYDNSGLLVGDRNTEITGALLCLDSTEDVIDEAIQKDCNLVIAHHPIIFSGLKRLTGEDYIQRTVIKAIQNNIAIYACHTNLDNVLDGVNAKIAQKIGLRNLKILSPKKGVFKLEIAIPSGKLDAVSELLQEHQEYFIQTDNFGSISTVGAGTNNNGSEAIISVEKQYTFKYQSQILNLAQRLTNEFNATCNTFEIQGKTRSIGSGMIGKLDDKMKEIDFLNHLKHSMELSTIKYTELLGKKIKKVAICGGSGGFLLNKAISAGADIFITSDYKYHEYFDADKRIIIADIGHYESERFTIEIFHELLTKKFNTFAVHYSETKTNPVNYL